MSKQNDQYNYSSDLYSRGCDSTAELYIWIIFTEQVKENHKIMVLTK